MTLAMLLQYVLDETFLFKCYFPHYDHSLNRFSFHFKLTGLSQLWKGGAVRGGAELDLHVPCCMDHRLETVGSHYIYARNINPRTAKQ